MVCILIIKKEKPGPDQMVQNKHLDRVYLPSAIYLSAIQQIFFDTAKVVKLTCSKVQDKYGKLS